MPVYITTPIFYASGEPHLGHVYSSFIADTLKRYYRLRKAGAFLISGTDENGLKIEKKAKAQNIDVAKFVLSKSLEFQNTLKQVNLSPDSFIRTTELAHHELVADIWRKFRSTNSIYLGNYKGLYCVDCEQYYSERQLNGDCCPVHGNQLDTISEPTYLFRLNKYRKQLIQFYQSNPDFIRPKYLQEKVLRNLQESELEDLSVSRTKVKWGIPVPGDESHTIYVWLDALFSYFSALIGLQQTGLSLNRVIHVIGKDIFNFHSIYWPIFLLAADLPLPKKIIVHGWWTSDGKKISKSDPQTEVDPQRFVNALGCDGLRYGLLSSKPLDRDGDINEEALKRKINSDLANNLGNLVKRFTSLVHQRYCGTITWSPRKTLHKDSRYLVKEVNGVISEIEKYYEKGEIFHVCRLAEYIVSKTNAYFQQREPWRVGPQALEDFTAETLVVIYSVLNVILRIYDPIIPTTARRIQQQLLQDDVALTWPKACVLKNVRVGPPGTIFDRIA